jgi:hypothetical protein
LTEQMVLDHSTIHVKPSLAAGMVNPVIPVCSCQRSRLPDRPHRVWTMLEESRLHFLESPVLRGSAAET